jgi:NAD(P)-dependent dehydrogenase (short-subunit alcohol dehydrogenase family)
MSQQNPIAVITGGSRGLGKSMALHLAERGVDVVLTYQSNEAAAREVVSAFEAKGRKAVALRLDVGDSKQFAAFAGALKEALASVWKRDRFDFLVNNAGSALYKPFLETTEEEFDTMVNVHLKSTFFLTQTLVPLMNDGGRILNVSSGLARFSYPGSSAYGAMKGGIETLTRYLARELGARKITANVVAPGAIETDFGGGHVRDTPELNKMIAQQTALGRVGLPDDIGGAVSLLLAPELGWMNGQRIELSGGIQL